MLHICSQKTSPLSWNIYIYISCLGFCSTQWSDFVTSQPQTFALPFNLFCHHPFISQKTLPKKKRSCEKKLLWSCHCLSPGLLMRGCSIVPQNPPPKKEELRREKQLVRVLSLAVHRGCSPGAGGWSCDVRQTFGSARLASGGKKLPRELLGADTNPRSLTARIWKVDVSLNGGTPISHPKMVIF